MASRRPPVDVGQPAQPRQASPIVELGKRRAKSAKTTVAIGSAVMFLGAIPLVQGTRESHPRPTHPLTPPAAMVEAVAQGGFEQSALAPSQAPPIVASGGS